LLKVLCLNDFDFKPQEEASNPHIEQIEKQKDNHYF